MKKYAEYAVKKAAELIAIDSPTGYTARAAEWVKNEFEALGYKSEITNKGGVMITLSEAGENGLLLQAHADTLGGMVSQIKGDGRLKLTALGGMRAENGETENVRVYTRDGNVYDGKQRFPLYDQYHLFLR